MNRGALVHLKAPDLRGYERIPGPKMAAVFGMVEALAVSGYCLDVSGGVSRDLFSSLASAAP